MKRLLLLPLIFSACPSVESTASIDLIRIGGETITTTAGVKSFVLSVASGSIAIAQLNLVDFESNEETKMIAAPLVFDFIGDPQLSIDPVFVIPAQYEQVHVLPDNQQVTVKMIFDVSLSTGAVVQGELALQMPFLEEQQLDALIKIEGGVKEKITVGFDPAKVFSGVDFDLVSNAAPFLIEANSADPNIASAFDLIVENVFTAFAFISAN